MNSYKSNQDLLELFSDLDATQPITPAVAAPLLHNVHISTDSGLVSTRPVSGAVARSSNSSFESTCSVSRTSSPVPQKFYNLQIATYFEGSSEFPSSSSPTSSEEIVYSLLEHGSINSLDDKTLIRILKRIPLQLLVMIRRVCLRWLRVIERDILSKKTRVKLFRSVGQLQQSIGGLTDSDIEARLYSHHECLILAGAENSAFLGSSIHPFYLFLTRAIPKMESIVFYCAPVNSHDMMHVLNKWRKSLGTLSLANLSADLDWSSIWRKIGYLPHLRHLILKSHWCLKNPVADLPQLKHLDSLSIFNYPLSKLLPIMDRFESSLTSFTLVNSLDHDNALREWISRKGELRHTLTHLVLDGKGSLPLREGVSERVFKMICRYLKALTNLDVKFGQETKLITIIENIYELKNLTTLTIRSTNPELCTELNPKDFLRFDNYFHLSGSQPSAAQNHLHSNYFYLLASPSLTTLNLEVKLDVRKLLIPQALFPNLRNLVINVASLDCEHASLLCGKCLEGMDKKFQWKCLVNGGGPDAQGLVLKNRGYVEFVDSLIN